MDNGFYEVENGKSKIRIEVLDSLYKRLGHYDSPNNFISTPNRGWNKVSGLSKDLKFNLIHPDM